MMISIQLIQFVLVIGIGLLSFKLIKRNVLEAHTKAVLALPEKQLGMWIALAAGLSLFAELMIIRFHSSYFHIFAYFKNVSLLSCFLGLGIGYALTSRRTLTTPFVLPLMGFQIYLLFILRSSLLAEILQNPIPENLILGADHSAQATIQGFITYAFILFVFSLNALCFIPLGHLISTLMKRLKPLVAYSWNLIGSLAGIIFFSYISFLWAPPFIWILWLALGLIAFLLNSPRAYLPSLLASLLIMLIMVYPPSSVPEIYSPYQVLRVFMSKNHYPMVGTNNVYYQRILDLSPKNIQSNPLLQQWADYYNLPFTFKPQPQDVLVVGSGTGNDVAAALRNRAGKIDAVEIDPAILDLGKKLHREAPYQASNVRVTVDDARAFIRRTDKRYDLIVYGLLDSHTLLSSKSGGIRLDSYIYTVEGLRDARKKLKDGGVICLTFCILRKELGRKLFLMLQDAFDGKKPLVYQAEYDGGYAFLAGDKISENMLAHHSKLKDVTKEFDDENLKADRSTDDWPFLYMPVKKYPLSYLVMIVLLVIVSALFIRRFLPGTTKGFSAPCFFLGAGFMLIETKGITELALAYGSTWLVISIVISCIMLMAFFANLIVSKTGPISPRLSYGALAASLLVGYGMTFTNISGSSPWLIQITMPLLLTLPLFFSGFIFSTEIKRTNSIATALSSNLLGAMLGGFLEYNSMYFGFRSLYLFALIMYVFAFLGSGVTKRAR
jgi:SAM-dependent methyltransferase